MKRKTLLMLGLGLLASCDRLFQSQLGTDPALCTQSSSLCPSGQLCDFTSGTCQPIGGTNPPGWSLSAAAVGSCPQAPTITITGPSAGTTPKVLLNSLEVDPAEVAVGDDGALTITLPRQLPPGVVQVSLSFSATEPPVVFSPGFRYETKTAAVTALLPVASSLAKLPPDVLQLATWHPRRGGALDLAALGLTGTPVVHYRDAVVASRQTPTFAHLFSSTMLADGTALQTGNLATAVDSQSGDEALLTTTASAGSAAFFIAGSDTPVVKKSVLGSMNFPVLRQMVAGGYFRDDGGPIQALTFIGWQSGTTALPVQHSPGPGVNAAASDFVTIQTPVKNFVPVALASGRLNGDAYTDVLALLSGGTGPATYACVVSGGPTPVVYSFPQLPPGTTTVALGTLDSDALPDAVLGINSGAGTAGQLVIYLNQSAQTAPTVSWDAAKAVTVATRNAPTALAVADYDGDGRNDIIYAASDGVHVLLNQAGPAGQPGFTDFLVYGGNGWTVSSLATADFSGDSRLDVIVADTKNHTVVLLENSCSPAS